MIAWPDSTDTSNFRHYHVVWYWDDATYDSGTTSTGVCEPLTNSTTYITYATYATYQRNLREENEFLITTKEINRIKAREVLKRRVVDIPRFDFEPKKIRKNNRMMFCQRR